MYVQNKTDREDTALWKHFSSCYSLLACSFLQAFSYVCVSLLGVHWQRVVSDGYDGCALRPNPGGTLIEEIIDISRTNEISKAVEFSHIFVGA